jgi:tRNA 2-selenouridine synthase
VNPQDFIAKSTEGVIFDARSPAEYAEGHIPGALSLPLFSDEERAEVGTCYKQHGKAKAVRLGLEIVGPKMASLLHRADVLAGDKDIYLHCWRGGMRSGSLSWLLKTGGKTVHLLDGGYKAYRTWMYEQFERPFKFTVVGGMTGSGKTEILQELQGIGEQVIDLEGLANHRGSAFGAVGKGLQPSVEHFQNLLHHAIQQLDLSRTIWVEDESQHIGKVWINQQFFVQLKSSPLYVVDRPLNERVEHLCRIYGEANNEEFNAIFQKIGRRLGGQHVKSAVEAIDAGNLASAAEIALTYYDKSYRYMLDKRKLVAVATIDASGMTPADVAHELITLNQERIRGKSEVNQS